MPWLSNPGGIKSAKNDETSEYPPYVLRQWPIVTRHSAAAYISVLERLRG